MKTKIYCLLIMLAMLLPTITLRGEVITGTSELFVFGTPPPPVPLSPLALVVAFFLIGTFVYRRYLIKKKQAV